jgi:branched-chain amino acid transport system permease protein
MHEVLQQIIIGLSIGATYALIALGYTMVYGVLRLINFAHGEVYMVGAVAAYYAAHKMTAAGHGVAVTLAVMFLGAMAVCAALGFVIEFFAYRPLRARPRLVSLITAIGVSLLLQNLVQSQHLFGPTPRNLPRLMEGNAFTITMSSGTVHVSQIQLLSFVLSIVVMGLLTWIVLGTRVGLALRAVSHRVDTAALMGINTNRTISYTFMLGSALAAVAGVMDAVQYNVKPLMGVMPGLKAFIAAVLGGIGSIPGALLGAFLLGLVETMARWLLPRGWTEYADGVAFVVLILVLLFRPAGLLGRNVREKV